MTKKGNLTYLIKSLSKSEKRYIKIYLQRNGEDSNYLDLFNFIDKPSTTTDKQIRLKFKNKTFTKQLHVTKNYLIKIILRALKNFHQKTNRKIELLNSLLDIELLLKKDQFDLAGFYIQKTLEKALKTENHTIYYYALNLKRRFLNEKSYSALPLAHSENELKQKINSVLELQNNTLINLQNINEYYQLNNNFFDFFKETSKFSTKSYSELSKHPLLQNQEKALTLESKILFNHIHFQLSVFQNKNYDHAADYLQKILYLIEKEPAFLQEATNIYISTTNQLINLYLHLKNYIVIPALLEKIRELPQTYQLKTSHPETLKGLLQSYLYELELYKHTGQSKLALQLIPNIETFIKENNYPVTKKLLPQFQFLFAYFNFSHGQISKALFHLKPLLKKANNQSNSNISKENILAGFLEILCQHEQNNSLEFKNSLNRNISAIKAQRRLQFEEKLLFNYFSEIQKAKIEETQINQQMFDYLQNHFLKENQGEIINELGFTRWLQKKLIVD